MRRIQVYPDHSVIPAGAAFNPDNHTDTFTVVLRSFDGVTREEMMKRLQYWNEVMSIEHTDKVVLGRKP